MDNLTESMREKVVDNGWKEVFAFGRKRPVWTPEALRAAFVEYLGFADGSPLPKEFKVSSKVGGKNGDVDEDTERRVFRPYNMKSMCARLGIADWEKFKARYCEGASDEAQEFAELCARIENFIHGNLQEGATAGTPAGRGSATGSAAGTGGTSGPGSCSGAAAGFSCRKSTRAGSSRRGIHCSHPACHPFVSGVSSPICTSEITSGTVAGPHFFLSAIQ